MGALEQPFAPLRRPVILRAHGDERIDDFYWMQDRADPRVREYLEEENEHADTVIEKFLRLRSSWEETWATRDPVSPSVPVFTRGGFVYERYWTAGAWRLTRQPAATKSRRAQIVVDSSVYGARSLGFNQGGFDVSPDNRVAAIAFERVGSERFTIRIRDIDRNRDLGYAIEPVGPSLAWLDDDTLLYTRLNAQGTASEVCRHERGKPQADTVVYQETAPGFGLRPSPMSGSGLAKIVSEGHSSSEVRLLAQGEAPRLLVRRQPGVRYDVQYHPGQGGVLFALVQTDDRSRLLAAPSPGRAEWSQWRTVYESPTYQRAVDFAAYAGYLVVAEEGRELRLQVIDLAGEWARSLPLTSVGRQDALVVQFGRDFDRPVVWTMTSGPANPATYVEVDVTSGTTKVIYRAPAPRQFEAGVYRVEEWTASAPDGVEVPLSVFYRRDGKGLRPCVLYGYGAYGHKNIAGFSRPALTLADRGWVIAHAHVRGGGELGPAWHAAGRRMQKRNSIDDYLACAERLANSGPVDPDRMAARGASAGGTLVCAAVNQRPSRFRAAVVRVPFVDCLTSLLDASNRITEFEWDELGNPIDDPEVYRYIRSYSPYDNIRPGPYPAMLVTAGYQDARVPFWEPAKYVAKLRATRTDNRLLLFRTAMQSGHSNRWGNRSEESYIMAFLVSEVE